MAGRSPSTGAEPILAGSPIGSDVPLDAIVVLGCAVARDAVGRLSQGTLSRRLDAAATTYAHRASERTVVVVSGGRRWGEVVEADIMARELECRGVPQHAIVRERCSLTTRDNARFTAEALRRRGLARAVVVTCVWHLPRAIALFRRTGLAVEGIASIESDVPSLTALWRRARELVLTWVQLR